MFQMFQNLQKNQNDPQEMISKMVNNYKPEQINQFREYAKGFGITDEQLKKFGIGSK